MTSRHGAHDPNAVSTYGRYVGRVGALAVALGIGAAITTGQGIGVACADDDTGTSATAADGAEAGPASSDPGATEPEDADPAPDSTDDEEEAAEADELDAEDPPGDVDDELTLDEEPVEEAATPDDTSPTEPSGEATKLSPSQGESVDSEPPATSAPEPPEPANIVPPVIDDVEVQQITSPSPVGEAAEATPVAEFSEPAETPDIPDAVGLSRFSAPVDETPEPANLLVSALLSPFLAPGPPQPAQPPVLWTMLAWVRRELQRSLFNHTPRAAGDVTTASVSVPKVIAVLANDTDDDSVTVKGFTQAAHGTVVLNEDKTFTYTPEPGYSGTDSFTYTISDAASPWHLHGFLGFFGRGHNSTATVTITVVDVPPVVGDDPYSLKVNDLTGIVTGHVNVTDANEDPLSYSVATDIDPTIGSVTVDSATGFFAFAPTSQARHDAASSGDERTVAFTIVVSDGRESVTVDVVAPVVPGAAHPDDDGTLSPGEFADLVDNGSLEIIQNSDGTVRVIDGAFTDNPVRNAAEAAEAFNRIAELLGMASEFASADDITVQRVSQVDDDGNPLPFAYYHLSPTIDGVPVVGSDAVLVTDGGGTVLGVFNGLNTTAGAVDLTPADTLDEDAEVTAVVRAVLRDRFGGGDIDAETLDELMSSLTYTGDLVVYQPDPEQPAQLAWQVVVTTPGAEVTDDSAATRFVVATYYVQANGTNSGAILLEQSGLQGAAASTAVYANDLLGVRRIFRVMQAPVPYAPGRQMFGDPTRGITTYSNVAYLPANGKNSNLIYAPPGSVILYDPANPNRSAVSAHANTAIVYDYYRYSLGYLPGGPVAVAVVPYLAEVGGYLPGDDGASLLVFGDKGEAALDIVAHEYTHSVISNRFGVHNFGLTYKNGFGNSPESNALDEAYGDILGSLIEAKSKADLEFILADDRPSCASPGELGCGIRDFSTPSRTGNAFTYSQFDKFASSYRNSTIFSRAAYLMIADPDAKSVSRDEWARVYAASLFALPQDAQFVDARAAVIMAAKAQGFTGAELEAVKDAFDEVEIEGKSRYVPPTSAAPTPTYLTRVSLDGTPLNIAVSRDGRFVYVDSMTNTYTPETGPRVAIAVTQVNTVSGSSTTTTLSEIGAGGTVDFPFGIASSPDGRYLYIVNATTSTMTLPTSVTVFDTKTNSTVGSPIPIGTYPAGRAVVSPDGKILYVATQNVTAGPVGGVPQGTISVIDTSTKTVTRTIPVGYVQDFVMSTDGSRLYSVGQQISATGTIRPVISVINSSSGAVTRNIVVSEYRSIDDGVVTVADVTTSPDNRRVYAMVVDSQESNSAYSINVYDSSSGALIDTYDQVGEAYGNLAQRGRYMVLSADGRYLYVRDGSTQTIKVIDTRSGEYAGDPVSYATASPSAADMVLSPDGKQLYLVSPTGAGGTLSVYNLL